MKRLTRKYCSRVKGNRVKCLSDLVTVGEQRSAIMSLPKAGRPRRASEARAGKPAVCSTGTLFRTTRYWSYTIKAGFHSYALVCYTLFPRRKESFFNACTNGTQTGTRTGTQIGTGKKERKYNYEHQKNFGGNCGCCAYSLHGSLRSGFHKRGRNHNHSRSCNA